MIACCTYGPLTEKRSRSGATAVVHHARPNVSGKNAEERNEKEDEEEEFAEGITRDGVEFEDIRRGAQVLELACELEDVENAKDQKEDELRVVNRDDEEDYENDAVVDVSKVAVMRLVETFRDYFQHDFRREVEDEEELRVDESTLVPSPFKQFLFGNHVVVQTHEDSHRDYH